MSTCWRLHAWGRRCAFERCEDRLALSAASGDAETLFADGNTILLDVDTAVYFDLSGDRFDTDATELDWRGGAGQGSLWPADADAPIALEPAGGDVVPSRGTTTLSGGAIEAAANEFAAAVPLRTIATVQNHTTANGGWIALPMVDAHRIEPVSADHAAELALVHPAEQSPTARAQKADALDARERPSGRAVFFEVAALDSAVSESSVRPSVGRPADTTQELPEEPRSQVTATSPDHQATAHRGASQVAAMVDLELQAPGDGHRVPEVELREVLRQSSTPAEPLLPPDAVDVAFEELGEQPLSSSAAPVRWSNSHYPASLGLAVAVLVAVEQSLASRRAAPTPAAVLGNPPQPS